VTRSLAAGCAQPPSTDLALESRCVRLRTNAVPYERQRTEQPVERGETRRVEGASAFRESFPNEFKENL